jgi:hypothetical protein
LIRISASCMLKLNVSISYITIGLLLLVRCCTSRVFEPLSEQFLHSPLTMVSKLKIASH